MSAPAAYRASIAQTTPEMKRGGPVLQPHGRGWGVQTLRMNPYALPQSVQFAAVSNSANGDVLYTVDHGGAVMKRTLSCGLPVSMSVPKACFEGVVARTFETDSGETSVSLELLHSDIALSVPLCVSKSLEEVAADWHSWSNTLGLPMLLEDERGVLVTVKQRAGVESRTAKPRRRRIAGVRHRPNFLRRRRTPMIGPVEVLRAEEIIART
ncbi:MAG: DUF6101 family protein [Pseudomonadota bacterium]